MSHRGENRWILRLLVQKDVFAVMRRKWQNFQKSPNFAKFWTNFQHLCHITLFSPIWSLYSLSTPPNYQLGLFKAKCHNALSKRPTVTGDIPELGGSLEAMMYTVPNFISGYTWSCVKNFKNIYCTQYNI